MTGLKDCRLDECPPGLFMFKGTLCFKSEYTTTLQNPPRYECDAYVVESGEYFYGGARNTQERAALIVTPTRQPDAALVEALEPSGDTKAAYMGEFSFNLRRVDEFGDEYSEKVYVPWDTIKEIMAAIRARATLTARAG